MKTPNAANPRFHDGKGESSGTPFSIPYSLASFLYSDWLDESPEAYIEILRLVFDKDLPRKLEAGGIAFPGDDCDKRLILAWNAAFFRERERHISDAKTRRRKERLEMAGTKWKRLHPPAIWEEAARASGPTPPRIPAGVSADSALSGTHPAGGVAATGEAGDAGGGHPLPGRYYKAPLARRCRGQRLAESAAKAKVDKVRGN